MLGGDGVGGGRRWGGGSGRRGKWRRRGVGGEEGRELPAPSPRRAALRARFGSGLTTVVPEGEKERERCWPGRDGRQRRGGAARLRPLCRHAVRDKRLRAGSAPSGWCAPPLPALLHYRGPPRPRAYVRASEIEISREWNEISIMLPNAALLMKTYPICCVFMSQCFVFSFW